MAIRKRWTTRNGQIFIFHTLEAVIITTASGCFLYIDHMITPPSCIFLRLVNHQIWSQLSTCTWKSKAMTMSPGIPFWQCMAFQLYNFIVFTHSHIGKTCIEHSFALCGNLIRCSLELVCRKAQGTHFFLGVSLNYTEMFTGASTTAMSGSPWWAS